MKNLVTLGLTIFALFTLGMVTNAQIMTREEAAVIARAVCDKIGLSSQPLKWQTTQELPTPVEVAEDDYDLQDLLALMGYNPQPTLCPYPFRCALPFVSTPYDGLNYIYWCGDFMVTVNAYSGRVGLEKQGKWTHGESVLPEEQLESIAYQLAQAFLGNKPWRWDKTIPDNPIDSAYFYATTFDPSSDADLLDSVLITLNASTGELLDIEVYQRTVTISTEPLLSSDEAKKLAESVLKNFHPKATITAHPEETLLLVFEDSSLKQFLAWKFGYTVTYGAIGEEFPPWLVAFIMIDAHTGEVLWREEAIPMGVKLPTKKRHSFEGNLLVLNGKQMTFGQPLILRDGRVYLWIGYLPFFKIEQRDGYLVVKDRQIRLTKVDLIWFNGRQYVALRNICDFAGIRLWWDNERKVPVLRAEWLEARNLLAQRQR